MPLDNLYIDVFLTMVDFLEYDDVARLSTVNKHTHDMCDSYVQHALGVPVRDLTHFACTHVIDKQTRRQCSRVDTVSIEYSYCRYHYDEHTCWDCGRFQESLGLARACADPEGCCYKSVCRTPEGWLECAPLPCSGCGALKATEELQRRSDATDLMVCDDCALDAPGITYFPVIYWHGPSQEEYEERYGSWY